MPIDMICGVIMILSVGFVLYGCIVICLVILGIMVLLIEKAFGITID